MWIGAAMEPHRPFYTQRLSLKILSNNRKEVMDREEYIKDFIKVYRSLPCLWKVTCPDYSNRLKKNEAYKKLMEVVQNYLPGHQVDLKMVKAKIQNLRTAYRKELNKVWHSKRCGARAEEVYRPKLWYFSLLNFTRDQEVSDASQSAENRMEEVAPEPSCNATAAGSPPALDRSTMTEEQSVTVTQLTTTMQEIISQENTSAPVYPEADNPRPVTFTTRFRNRSMKAENMELLETAKLLLGHRPDEFEHIGQSIACKLRRMAEPQRIHYERIVTQLNTEALLGHLDEGSCLSNTNHIDQAGYPVEHMHGYDY
ncbi:uncharacterized protein [Eleutherodactylus coqui]|uniref:uncharacterized protein n=1 Tax=Eleutherodactylus coqui TaxID=57060 RepID=UPI0034631FC5